MTPSSVNVRQLKINYSDTLVLDQFLDVFGYLAKLEDKGYIKKQDKKNRPQ